MYRWRISLFGKTPARSLGVIVAPDQEAAIKKAIEFLGIESALRFRVVATQLDKVDEKARSKQRANQDD